MDFALGVVRTKDDFAICKLKLQFARWLASAIQTMVDERRPVPGQYILTGSHQPVLKQTVTQSLAGRIGQLLNLNSLSCEVGVSHTTLGKWIDVLEASSNSRTFSRCEAVAKPPHISFSTTEYTEYTENERLVIAYTTSVYSVVAPMWYVWYNIRERGKT